MQGIKCLWNLGRTGGARVRDVAQLRLSICQHRDGGSESADTAAPVTMQLLRAAALHNVAGQQPAVGGWPPPHSSLLNHLSACDWQNQICMQKPSYYGAKACSFLLSSF